jgi:hypothetical protein
MDEIEQGLKTRYSHIHPLIFQISCEKAKDYGELFDILETIPDEYPIVWDHDERRWLTTELLQIEDM